MLIHCMYCIWRKPRPKFEFILKRRDQCCGAKTICFRCGSDFQKVSALAPTPAPATALELPVITDFILKSTLFMFFMKEINLIYMLDPIQYEF
jgi:hypothetical protein